MENKMQPTNATATTAIAKPLDSASDITGRQTDAADASSIGDTATLAAATAVSGTAAVKVSLSEAARAYLSQPVPPSISETQRAKKKPKMKQLVELMLEWSKKYAEQRDLQQKAKQLAVRQGVAPSGAALTTTGAKKPPLAQPIAGNTDN
jgi:hypothetical protein